MTFLLMDIVVQTRTPSLTGKYLYSDFVYEEINGIDQITLDSKLNEAARIPIIGIAAGIARMALAVIHTIGHLFMAAVTSDKGHLYHAAKGACEFLRGIIEAIPIIGRIFSYLYSTPSRVQEDLDDRSWWMIKIYNPDQPDALDRVMQNWAPLILTNRYIVA